MRAKSIIGSFWDLNDTLLTAQGLLDAVSMQVAKNSGFSGHLEGHTLGAARANVLMRKGIISSAHLLAVQQALRIILTQWRAVG